MGQLICEKCGAEVPVPVHCGQEMHIEGDQLVCCMGAVCGQQDIPEHCGTSIAHKE